MGESDKVNTRESYISILSHSWNFGGGHLSLDSALSACLVLAALIGDMYVTSICVALEDGDTYGDGVCPLVFGTERRSNM